MVNMHAKFEVRLVTSLTCERCYATGPDSKEFSNKDQCVWQRG